LKNNQIKSIELIISYIVKYQNVYSSSFLFKKNFKEIVEKGVYVQDLLNSKVYNMEFSFDQWPSIHEDS
jgi:hypothetical protein